MVDAVLKMARLSSIFTQDIENDTFMEGSVAITQESPDSEITAKQKKRIFAIAASNGMSTEQARTWLKAQGFGSTKDIRQKDYDGLCAKLSEVGNAG